MNLFKNKKALFFLVIILALIPITDLFHQGLPVTHDGIDHVARISNFYDNLKEGNFIPRWAGNLNWGYGHPILMFLYPLSSYLASFFHFAGINLIDSTKIVFGLGMVFSGVFMFLWIAEFLPPYLGVLAGVVYMLTPYRLVDLYVRGDIGENLAFVFIPLVFFSLIRSLKSEHRFYKLLVSFSVACLVLSHNAISLMTTPLIFFYAWLLSQKNRKIFLELVVHILLGFGIAAFFWIPGLFEGKYTLRDIVTKGSYSNRFVPFSSLVYGPWSYGGTGQFTVQLGFLNWIGLVSAITLFIRRNKNIRSLEIFFVCVSLIGIFLMLPPSRPIWDSLLILQNFQFPWRFLALTTVTTSVLLPIALSTLQIKTQKILTVILLVLCLFVSKDYWHAKDFTSIPQDFFTGVYNGTTDTGESAPRWSVRFMEHRPKAPIEIIDGDAKISTSIRKITDHEYIVAAERKTRIKENTIYFPGWDVFSNGVKLPIEYQDQANRGLITFYVEKGEHKVSVIFKETRLRTISDIISFASIVLCLVLFFKLWRFR